MHRAVVVALLLASTAIADAKCRYPLYSGMTTHFSLRFTGKDKIGGDSGTILIAGKPRYKFSTTFSNGFSQESILIEVQGRKEPINSVMLRYNDDFSKSSSDFPDFIVTPDLPVSFYYSSYDRPPMDDTWKLISCQPTILDRVR